MKDIIEGFLELIKYTFLKTFEDDLLIFILLGVVLITYITIHILKEDK